jgi:hypothetical protein
MCTQLHACAVVCGQRLVTWSYLVTPVTSTVQPGHALLWQCRGQEAACCKPGYPTGGVHWQDVVRVQRAFMSKRHIHALEAHTAPKAWRASRAVRQNTHSCCITGIPTHHPSTLSCLRR